jgi:hypothetical protein
VGYWTDQAMFAAFPLMSLAMLLSAAAMWWMARQEG